jgi:hypothetical protein
VAPPLAGDEFVLSWGRAGRTLDDLFFITRTTMPEGEGGTLSEEQYLDVLAYMLLRNGYSAGERELTADATELTAVSPRESGRRGPYHAIHDRLHQGVSRLGARGDWPHPGRSERGRRKQ